MLWQDIARGLAQAALCAIAGNSVADLFGTGETHADARRFIFAAFAGLQVDAGGGVASCF